jgi:hypothetical protein
MKKMKTAESVLKKARKRGIPVLVLTAQDECSIDGINEYFSSCRKKCSPQHAYEIGQIFSDFILWQAQNLDRVKLPD